MKKIVLSFVFCSLMMTNLGGSSFVCGDVLIKKYRVMVKQAHERIEKDLFDPASVRYKDESITEHSRWGDGYAIQLTGYYNAHNKMGGYGEWHYYRYMSDGDFKDFGE